MKRIFQVLKLSLRIIQYLLAKRPQHLRAIDVQTRRPPKPQAIAQQLSKITVPVDAIDVQVVPPQPITALPAEPNSTDRQALVRGLLDEAWAQGMRTYPQLIGYVQEQTGTACGRRMVAAWKKDRKLTDDNTAA
ncbi:hypothetical protein [Thermoleptolyngbya sp.]